MVKDRAVWQTRLNVLEEAAAYVSRGGKKSLPFSVTTGTHITGFNAKCITLSVLQDDFVLCIKRKISTRRVYF